MLDAFGQAPNSKTLNKGERVLKIGATSSGRKKTHLRNLKTENKIGRKWLGEIYVQNEQIKALLYNAVDPVLHNLCCVPFLINRV